MKSVTHENFQKNNDLPFAENMSLITNIISLIFFLFGFISPIFSHELKYVGLFALSGALTNWIAVHMLFEKVPGLYGSGIIPNKFQDFKKGIRTLIMQQFFTEKNIVKFFQQKKTDLSIDDSIKSISEKINYNKMFDKIIEAILESPLQTMLMMVGGGQALEPARPFFLTKMEASLLETLADKSVVEQIKNQMHDKLDPKELHEHIENIVVSHLETLTPKMVKTIIEAMIKKHLGWLVVWGGVFGGLIGLFSSFFTS
ncbi:MAG: DUF445 domain-containing protein [Zetaproteobacteria bacterium]|nr:DUF445 domain-containing protein [Pseudobdellovibrionaceae bacterium]